MRALIVDDSRFVRTYMRGLLEKKGIECEEAGDGKAGLELLQTGVLAGADPRDPSAAVSNSYEEEVINEYGTKRTRRRDGLYAQARSVSPRLKGVSDHKLGRYLRDQGCTNEWVRRRRGWQFPPLIDCRKKWEVRFPDMKWRDPTIEAWTCEQEE